MNGDQQTELGLALKLSLPALFAYFPLGIVFGILFENAGFAWYFAPIMSIFNYAGAVQFVALGLMAKHASLFAIVFATIFIALRNSFYGLSLLERYNVHWLKKAFLMFSLVDATYAVLMTNPPRKGLDDEKFCLYLSALMGGYWIMGSFIGAIGARWLPPVSSLAFILPCFFMVLVVEYFLSQRRMTAIVVPITASLIAYLISPQESLLVAIVLSIAAILIIDKFFGKKSNGG